MTLWGWLKARRTRRDLPPGWDLVREDPPRPCAEQTTEPREADPPPICGSEDPSSRGWGAPCRSPIVTISRRDGLKLAVHRDVAALVALLCDRTEQLGYDLRPGQCWGYSCRRIRGSAAWSYHAWGLAIDLNAPENPQGERRGRIRAFPAVISTWKNYGFAWGGEFRTRPDDMHFEFRGTPADARAATERARRELGGQAAPPPPPAPQSSAPPSPPPAHSHPTPLVRFVGDPVRAEVWHPEAGRWFRQTDNSPWWEVQDIQRHLTDHGIDPGPTDGVGGPRTLAAVRAFQRARGLAADGIVGSATWRALHS